MPLSGLHDYTYIRKPFVLTVHTIGINVLVHAFLHRFEQRLQYLRLVVNHIYTTTTTNDDKNFISRGHSFDNKSIFHEGLKQ